MSSHMSDELPPEYASLADAALVMREMLRLLAEVQRLTTRLGDAFVAAGVPARSWLSDDARLSLLSEQLPDIPLDAVFTRLAEFAAGLGPGWLHSTETGLEQFRAEVTVLYDAIRPLRALAQRYRLLSPPNGYTAAGACTGDREGGHAARPVIECTPRY